ncbi:adenosylcobinamide-phosphate synthase CbiB [Desulfocurvus vexinensis]|uniref:adenosylcobinamide-phosphate synthase CbiB n=1 Tax=Desulfocurvus vexinensis TaxID=399548 RepID=UPI00048CB209|nr:adenosylcobinamide-phosphate synthase CbiB [Desulfocurvus vexinensis]
MPPVPLYLPPLAVGLDLALGDPQGWPHPVRAIGALVARLEGPARRAPGPERLRGALCVLVAAGAAGAAAWAATRLPWVGWLAGVYLAYAGLALGALLAEGRAVLALLEGGDLEGARRALAMLVSRDTAHLDEEGVCRALAETLAENLGDGFVAPFFYLVLLGLPGLWAYKAVSTMDSMWGYRTERWRGLGWACARLDDVLAFVPSRLAALGVAAVSPLAGGAAVPLSLVRRDAACMASPNAGWPMAAAAWALGAGMGGPAVYFGQPVDKPRLGPQGGAWTPALVRRLMGLLRAAGLAVAGALWLWLAAWTLARPLA